MSILDKIPALSSAQESVSGRPFSEADLKIWLAIIPYEQRWHFDSVLNNLSYASGVRAGCRIGQWRWLKNDIRYEVSLTEEEVVIMKLSVIGDFKMLNNSCTTWITNDI